MKLQSRSVLDRALFLVGILRRVGLRLRGVGALNAESQCLWATVPDWLVRFSWGECCGSWVTFAWRMALSMVRDSVRGCRARLARALLLGRILWQLGYVRVAYGALIVERQCSWAVVVNASARGDSTGAVLGFGFMPVEISQVQFLGEVVFMPVACRQCSCATVQKTVEFPQLQCCHGGRCPSLCSSSTVVDVPVHMQRHGGSFWRCLRLSSSPELVDFPVLEPGFLRGLMAMRG